MTLVELVAGAEQYLKLTSEHGPRGDIGAAETILAEDSKTVAIRNKTFMANND